MVKTKYVLILLLLVLLAGCNGTNKTTPTPTQQLPPSDETPDGDDNPTAVPPAGPVIVSVNLGRPPETIDPVLAAPLDDVAQDMIQNLFVGLTVLDPDTGLVTPGFAREWELSPDGLTWTVYLRDDIHWMKIDPDSGQMEPIRPVSAADVVFAVKRACQPDTGAPLARAAFIIDGCREAYQTGSGEIGARVLNDVAVEFRLDGDPGLFPSILAMPIMYPVPVELVEGEGANWTDPDVIWTSGPFAVQQGGSFDTGLRLVANLLWPLERGGNVDVVQVFFAPGEGQYDVQVVASDDVSDISFDDSRFRRLVQPATTFIVFSYDTPPFDDVNVRQALSLGLDREAVIDVLAERGVVGVAAYTLTPPGMASAPRYGEVGAKYDREAAQAALAEAGYPECNGFPPVTLLIDESEHSKVLAEAYVSSWSESLGCSSSSFVIDSQPTNVGFITAQKLPSGRSDKRAGMIGLIWQVDIYDAHHWSSDILGCKDNFPDAYLNQARPCIEADADLLLGTSILEAGTRIELYGSIDEAFFGAAGEMPAIPVYFYARALAIEPWMEIYPIRAGALRFEQWLADPAGQNEG